MRRPLLALVLIAGLTPAIAHAAEPAAYVVAVEVVRDGKATEASVEVPPGGSGSAQTERRIPYATALASADPDEIPQVATVVVGNSFTVTPSERAGGLDISADIRLSRLSGMRRVESGGRAVDLPDVETVDIALRDAAMRPEDGAWIYEGDDALTGARLRIVARR